MAICDLSPAAGLDNGLGRTPLMGYNSWNDIGCKGLSETYVKEVANLFVEHGLDKLGYQYINLDDCWVADRDEWTKELIPDKDAFPHGMGVVADYVHSKGLKFGLYTDRGIWTCGARPGSSGHERQDMQLFADWGVDYLKVDSCNAPNSSRGAIAQYRKIRDALNATGRPIFYALCGWAPWYAEVGEALANSWRVARDVNGICELWNTISINSVLAAYAGPGAWNDPDALISSSPGHRVSMQPHQSRTQFTLWAIMAAPLILGANIGRLTPYDLATYTNREVIAIDQDPLGKQGQIVWESCPTRDVAELEAMANRDHYPVPPHCQQVWGRALANGDWAIAFVNWDVAPADIVLPVAQFQNMGFAFGVTIRDLWVHKDLGVHTGDFKARVEGNGHSVMFRVSPRQAFV